MPLDPRPVAALLALASAPLWAAGGSVCSARSPAQVVPVVELYTSEGCNSCPPADRWLSRLKPDSNTVALAFHVDYWDRLGWKDRFASAEHTRRQARQQASNGARFSYTPQVVIDGADRKDWYALSAPPAAPAARPASVALALERTGDRFRATVTPLGSAPARLAAFWAITESGHVTDVKAGENEGVVLRHDHVVREVLPVEAWAVSAAPAATLEFQPATRPDPAHPRSVNLVVVDVATGRPVQALKLGC